MVEWVGTGMGVILRVGYIHKPLQILCLHMTIEHHVQGLLYLPKYPTMTYLAHFNEQTMHNRQ